MSDFIDFESYDLHGDEFLAASAIGGLYAMIVTGNYNYHNEMAYIRGDITLLREKEYNENREKFRGRRGIPKITTIGKRVYENLISHLWLMDSDHPDSVELMRMAR